ncbi:MAG: hypothetical protein IJM38_09345 [Ruminococcus sp.]|nr:hypothetical protein [Ruminococcus sp.]
MKKMIKALLISSFICVLASASVSCGLTDDSSSKEGSEVVAENESSENETVNPETSASKKMKENDPEETENAEETAPAAEERELPTYSDIEIFKENGIFPSGKYILGEEMPEGVYLFKADQTGHGVEGVYADPSESKQISAAYVHFDGSRIAELKGNGYVHFSWCTAYDLSKHPEIVNDPFTSSGMFMVGRDIEPGEYHIVPDEGEYGDYAEWHIYSSINCIAPVERASGYGVEGDDIEGTTITLNEGEFLETQFCKIAK